MDEEGKTLTEPFLSSPRVSFKHVVTKEDSNLSMLEEETSSNTTEENIKNAQREVFMLMQRRKTQRSMYGSFRKMSSLFTIAFVIVLVTVLIAGSYITRAKNGSVQIQVSHLIPLMVALVVILVVLNNVVISLLKELLTWLFLYVPLAFIILDVTFVENDQTNESNENLKRSRLILLISFIIIESIVLTFGVIKIFIIPSIIGSKWFSKSNEWVEFYWSTKFGGDNDWEVSYSHRACSKKCTWSYRGQYNNKGLPHGFGLYIDDAISGETIRGKWKDGRPVAPFTSTHNRTSSSSRAVSIIFIQVGDDEFDQHNCQPTLTKPMRVGVASVECSVQGHFLRFLPYVDVVHGPEEWTENTWKDCLNEFRNHTYFTQKYLSSVTVSVDPENGLNVANHDHDNSNDSSAKPKHVTLRMEESSPMSYLKIDDWKLTTQRDALIIMPGFNSSVSKGCEMWSQFLSMTTLCHYVQPIYFGWPNGCLSHYWEASHVGACGAETRKRFGELLDGLRANGILRVHLISHSMGCQALLSAFQNKEDGSPSDVALRFKAPSERSSTNTTGDSLTCRTITILNPDFPLAAFKDHAFASIRNICNCITLVGDRNDTPLFFSHKMNVIRNVVCCCKNEKFPSILLGNKTPHTFSSLGAHFNLLYHEAKESNTSRDTDRNETEKTDSPNDDVQSQQFNIFKRTHWINEFHFPPSIVSGTAVAHEVEENKEWFDIDVIDTTSLDTNIKGLRHSSFQMNPIMLNDMEELIVTGQRASRRQTLVHRSGNMYSYCHAPSHVAM